MPGVAAPWGRATLRLSQLMRRVGYAAGGRGGSRLLGDFGVVTSDDTILRRVTAPSGLDHTDERVRVLGVDDWAWRKQQHYGTILMDLERHRVIDLLPVRSAGSFYKWLLNHPGVEVITRDRSKLYADVRALAHREPSRSPTATTSSPTSLGQSRTTFDAWSCRRASISRRACDRARLQENPVDYAAGRLAMNVSRPWSS